MTVNCLKIIYSLLQRHATIPESWVGRALAGHIFDLVKHATLSESGPIREFSYIRDNPLVTYSGTHLTGKHVVLIDSYIPVSMHATSFGQILQDLSVACSTTRVKKIIRYKATCNYTRVMVYKEITIHWNFEIFFAEITKFRNNCFEIKKKHFELEFRNFKISKK